MLHLKKRVEGLLSIVAQYRGGTHSLEKADRKHKKIFAIAVKNYRNYDFCLRKTGRTRVSAPTDTSIPETSCKKFLQHVLRPKVSKMRAGMLQGGVFGYTIMRAHSAPIINLEKHRS